MSSIALPALNVQPPQQTEGPLDQYKGVAQLKSLLANQQTQQLQQQALAQENQQRQTMLDDRKALSKTMLNADGKGFDPSKHDMTTDLPDLAMKNGMSPDGALDLRNKLIDSQTKVMGYKKDQLEILDKTHNALIGKLNGVLAQPVEQQADAWSKSVKELQQDGTIDAQTAAQHAQFPGSDAAKIWLNSLKGSQQQHADAKEEAETRDKNAAAQEKEIKNRLATNATPENFTAEVDRVAPGKDNAALNLRTKSMVQFALSRGDVEGATKAIAEAAAQVGQIEKETNPKVQQFRVQTAAAQGKAQADVKAAAARGSNAALAEVPEHLVVPATKDYAKAGEEFASAHQASQNLVDFISAAKSGNKEAVKIVPLQGALEIVTAQGIHRINRTEVDSMGPEVGSLYDKVAGHVGGMLTGKSITDSVLNDLSALQKKIDANGKTMHANKVKTINKTYGSKFEPMNFDDDTGGDATTSKGSNKPKTYADQFPVHQ